MNEKEQQIISAVNNRNMIGFTYNGLYRVVEPHVFGELNGVKAILAYQVDGESDSGFIPDWRRFNLDKIRNLVVSGEIFAIRRSSFDTVFAGVKKS